MTKRKSDFTLPTLDDLFSTQEMRDDAKLERIQELPLAELHPFEDHPFKVLDNEEMEKIVGPSESSAYLLRALQDLLRAAATS